MFQQLRNSCLAAVTAALVLFTASSPANAQCGPDGLDGGPCCASAAVNLPQFPTLTQDMRWLCFDQCQPTLNQTYCVKVGTPLPVNMAGGIVCGQYTIRFTVTPCGALGNVWNGLTRASYSRTWREVTPAGTGLQVWRFILNGDFGAGAMLPNTPCDRPGCMVQFNRVYFTGYIDYARDCATGQWQMAFGLDHECDGIHHSTASVRPAPAVGFHPTRSFTMVSPGATFVVNSTAPIQSDGPIVQQAMRWNNWALTPAICTFEEPCQGNFVANQQYCFCTSAVAAPGYIDSTVSAQSACGSSVSPSPIAPFLQKRVGGWTAPGTFPGNEFLLFDIGSLTHVNACTGIAGPQWFEGVETIGGFQAFDFAGAMLGRQFEDVESCNKSATSIGTVIGAPHVSYYVLNFNMP